MEPIATTPQKTGSPPRQGLFHRNFTLVVIGQIISLFGNEVLRFTFPLYVYQQTGSELMLGLVSAVAFLPMILMSPIGGMVADRVNKQKVMVFLDFFTAALIFAFTILMDQVSIIPLVIGTLMLLFGIQGAYSPTVQASLPLLSAPEHLLRSNAVVNLVQSLAGLLGPALAGLLFGLYGLRPILFLSIACFVFSAVMELFIRIPHRKQASKGGLLATVKADMSLSLRFILKEKPILAKAIALIFCFNLFLTSMIIIGMPVIITSALQLDAALYGAAQAFLGAGGLAGGILAGVIGSKLDISRCYLLLLVCGIGILPMGIPLLLGAPAYLCYGIILLMGFLLMGCATIFSVQMLTFMQIQTPSEIRGKVIACVIALTMCAQPFGQALYGALFEAAAPWLVLFLSAITSTTIAMFSKKAFAQLSNNF